jgi:hypothetical protein
MIRRRRGFLLLPFSWAAKWLETAAGKDASLLEDVFQFSPKRMHLLALALAHLEEHDSLERAPLLLRGTAVDILDRSFGRPIPGLKRLIKRMPPRVLARESYRDLIKLLQDPSAAEVLRHASEIDDESLAAILAMPKMLHPFVITMAKYGFSVEGLGNTFRCLLICGASANYAALEIKLGAVTKPSPAHGSR